MNTEQKQQKAPFFRIINRPVFVLKILLVLIFFAITSIHGHFSDVGLVEIFVVQGIFFAISWVFSKAKDVIKSGNLFYIALLVLYSIAVPFSLTLVFETAAVLVSSVQIALFTIMLVLPNSAEFIVPDDEAELEISPAICFVMYMSSIVFAIIAGRFFPDNGITFFVAFAVSFVLVSPAALHFMPSESSESFLKRELSILLLTVALIPPMFAFVVASLVASYPGA